MMMTTLDFMLGGLGIACDLLFDLLDSVSLRALLCNCRLDGGL